MTHYSHDAFGRHFTIDVVALEVVRNGFTRFFVASIVPDETREKGEQWPSVAYGTTEAWAVRNARDVIAAALRATDPRA